MMGLLRKMLGRVWPGKPLSDPNPYTCYLPGRSSTAGVDVTRDTALSLSAVFAAVGLLSRLVASLPIHVYRTYGRAKERATGHPAYRILHHSPNPEMTAFSFRQALEWHRLLCGNAYAEITWAGNGKPAAIWPVEGWRVRPKRRDDGQLYYEIDGEREIEPEDLLHIPLTSTDGIQGRSFLDFAVESLGLGIATQDFAGAWFGNGARPGAILQHPGNPNKEARQEFKRGWDERHKGASKAGGTAVLWGGWQWVGTDGQVDPQKSQLLEQRRFSTEEVSRWLGIPPHLLYDLTRATFCLPAGQTVLTEYGPVPIEQVCEGAMVWSRGESGLLLAPVIRSGCTGVDRILTIATTNRTLRCNAKHPILCRRKRLTQRTTGRGGAPTANGLCAVTWETRYIPAGELAVGDTIVTLDHLPDAGSLEACPTRLPTIGFMEFCGLLLGDGNVIRNKQRGLAYITIARAGHASYMDYYREVMVAEFRKINGSPVTLREGERQTRFSSLAAVRELQELGLSGNARTKRVPGWVFRLPESHRLAFVRGFLDADGSCDKLGRLSFSSCNREMLGQIRDLCIGCGIPVTNLRESRGVATLPNGEQKAFRQYSFTCSDPEANRRIGSRTPAYVARMEAGQPFKRKDRNYPRYGGAGFDEPGLGLARIKSIEVGPPEPVYDLTIEGTHSFVAEGVVVHNSNIEQQNLDFLVYSFGPILVSYEQEFDRKMLSPPDTYCKHSVNGLLRGDSASRSAFYREMINIGVLSPNDVRDLEDLNPVPGGDTYFFPLNMAPLDSLNKPPVVEAPPVEPAPPASEPAPEAPAVPTLAPAPPVTVPTLAPIVLETLARLHRVETQAVRRASLKPGRFLAWLEEWYPPHRLRLTEALSPILGDVRADQAARSWCERSQADLLALSDRCTPAQFADGAEELLRGWSSRVESETRSILEGANHAS